MDNLESQTYEVFETDPVKYKEVHIYILFYYLLCSMKEVYMKLY